MARAEPETLSARRLNRSVLARQHLLERADSSINAVIEDIGGLQTQYAPSAYLGLWSRLNGFERGDLTAAMERRDVIHGTLMRSTIHSVTARDYWPMVVGIRRSRREWIMRSAGSHLSHVDTDSAAADLRSLFENGPARAREISAAMTERGYPRQIVGLASVWVDLVRIPPSGTWERRANDLYELAERWLPPDSQPGGLPSEGDGVRLLLQRYLGGFGPARINDFANWAGVTLPLAKSATDRFELRYFKDEQGRELIDLPDAPLPPEDTPAPVRFLPVWDATLLVHCRRALILPEEFRPFVFNTRTPQSVNTFLVDGQVAGTWRYHAGSVTTESFVKLPPDAQHEVDEEAARLARFHAA